MFTLKNDKGVLKHAPLGNLALRDKLTLGLLSMTLVTVLLGIFTLQQYASVQKEFTTLKEEISPALLSIIPVKSSVAALVSTLDVSLARKRMVTTSDLAPEFNDIDQQLQTYVRYSRYIGNDRQKEAQAFERQTKAVLAQAHKIVDMIGKNEPWLQTMDQHHKLHVAYEALIAKAVPQEAYMTTQIRRAEHLIQLTYRKTVLLVWIGIALALLLSLLVSITLRHIMLHPLYKLYEETERVCQGDETCMLNITSDDEFGMLAQRINEIITKHTPNPKGWV